MSRDHSRDALIPGELVARLEAYRPTNEWGDPVHHMICDEAAQALADLQERLGRADALVEQMGEALVLASVAINAAFAQAQAEYQGHDRAADKHDQTVREGRTAIKAALEAGHSPKPTTANSVGASEASEPNHPTPTGSKP